MSLTSYKNPKTGSTTYIIKSPISDGCSSEFAVTVNTMSGKGSITPSEGSLYLKRNSDVTHGVDRDNPLFLLTNTMRKPVSVDFSAVVEGTGIEDMGSIEFEQHATSPGAVDFKIIRSPYTEIHPGQLPPLPGWHSK